MTKEEIIERLNRLEILSDMVRKGQPIDFADTDEPAAAASSIVGTNGN